MRASIPALLLASASATPLFAQYAEPSAVVLLEQAIGAASNLFGWAAVGLGDVNGDGVLDIAVSAPLATGGGRSSAGRVYALSGADGTALWSGAPDGGKVYVYSGASGTLLKTITSTTEEQNLGIDARQLGDLDGDGRSDLLVGAYGDGFGGPLPGAALVFSGHIPAPPNATHPAARPADPLLTDVGGDPTAGPLVASALEPFNLELDCSGALAGGPSIQLRPTLLATPAATTSGWLWIAGPVLFSCTGVHGAPSGIELPPLAALIGITYTAQGGRGGRLSSALTQTVGR